MQIILFELLSILIVVVAYERKTKPCCTIACAALQLNLL